MEINEMKCFEGKRVVLFLVNGYKFTTIVPKITSESIVIQDKYGNDIGIDLKSIQLVLEVHNDGF